jgi:hypothetical protein
MRSGPRQERRRNHTEGGISHRRSCLQSDRTGQYDMANGKLLFVDHSSVHHQLEHFRLYHITGGLQGGAHTGTELPEPLDDPHLLLPAFPLFGYFSEAGA